MKKKIIVVTTTLDSGGITSFLVPLVNAISELGHDVTLAYTSDEGSYLDRVDSKVTRHSYAKQSKRELIVSALGELALVDLARVFFRKHQKITNIASLQRLGYLSAKHAAFPKQKYDVAISTAEFYCNALVANAIHADRKIGWVHPDISAFIIDRKSALKILRKLDFVATVSHAGLASLKNAFPEDQERFLHIENMVDSERIKAEAKETVTDVNDNVADKRIVTVCRIDNSSKRLDRVIRVSKILKAKGYHFCWYIIGDGKDFYGLKKMIQEAGLADCVIMLGKKTNPYPYIGMANCFVLTSQYEGKPIVIEEAKILHTPIISTAYSSAEEQIPITMGAIVPNCDGVLEQEIAAKIMDEQWNALIRKQNQTYEASNQDTLTAIRSLLE